MKIVWVVKMSCILCMSSGDQIFIFSLASQNVFIYISYQFWMFCTRGNLNCKLLFFHYCIKSLGIECRCSDSVIIGSLWRDTSCTGAQGRYYISSHTVYIVGNAEFLSLSETLYVPIYQCLGRKKTIICCKLKPHLFSERAYPLYCAFIQH